MQATMVATDFAMHTACFASLVIHHSQLCRGGMSGSPLGGSPSGFANYGCIWISQERLSKVGFLKYLPALINNPGKYKSPKDKWKQQHVEEARQQKALAILHEFRSAYFCYIYIIQN